VHDNVDHAGDRKLAIVKTTGVSVAADLPHCGRLGSFTRGRGAGGIYRIATLAGPTETRPAARLLFPASGERYSAATTPRAFEAGSAQLLRHLRIADKWRPTERKRGSES